MKTLNERISITLDYMEPAETYPGNGDICVTKMHFLEIRQLIKDMQAELEKKVGGDIENRLADLLCFAMKYEPEHEDAIKGVSRRYLAAIEIAKLKGTIGTDTLPTPPNEDK